MDLKVPGAILPFGCAFLSIGVKTFGRLLQLPWRTRVKLVYFGTHLLIVSPTRGEINVGPIEKQSQIYPGSHQLNYNLLVVQFHTIYEELIDGKLPLVGFHFFVRASSLVCYISWSLFHLFICIDFVHLSSFCAI